MQRNLLFILIDSLRADLAYSERGSAKIPVLNRLRQQGTSFNQAIAAATSTTPCVGTIMTGLYPFGHELRDIPGSRLRPGCTTLAQILRQHGYRTIAIVVGGFTGGDLAPETGLDVGFEEYQTRRGRVHIYTEWRSRLYAELDRLARLRERWFLFLHLWEMHIPRYLSPAFDSSEFGKTRYERALSSLDHELGKILNRLDLEQTVVVLHGDHGERYEKTITERMIRKAKRHLLGWGAGRGWYKLGHGYHVYDFLVRVPLIFMGQGLFPVGTQIDAQVRQVDIMPTILEAMGIPVDQELKLHGRSLLPQITGKQAEVLPALMESSGLGNPDPRRRLMGVRMPPWKYVFTPQNLRSRPELYHLDQDPEESSNLIDRYPTIARQLQSLIATMLSGSP